MNLVNPNQSELSIRMNPVNPINSNFQSELIRSIRINPNDSEKFGFIRIDRIDSDWPDSLEFGYKFGKLSPGLLFFPVKVTRILVV